MEAVSTHLQDVCSAVVSGCTVFAEVEHYGACRVVRVIIASGSVVMHLQSPQGYRLQLIGNDQTIFNIQGVTV